MSDSAVLLGTFWKLNTMADGGIRLILDMQCTLAELAAMGLVPGVPFALARLEKEAAVAPQEKPKGGELAKQAGIWCADPRFQRWLKVGSEDLAREKLCEFCGVDSRTELDRNEIAADKFNDLISKPYRAFVNS